MDKNLPANAGEKIPHAEGQLSLCPTATEAWVPVLLNQRAAAVRSPLTSSLNDRKLSHSNNMNNQLI